jgi:CheY-like chemotaxis protein
MSVKTDISGVALPIEILVVEDNVGDAYLLLKYLNSAKVTNHTIVVRDGQDASDYLNKKGLHSNAKRPDLVFLDLNLPRKDGRIILRELKENPELSDIPVLVLTTSSWEQDVTEAYDYHANLYLVKPPDLEQFLASMKYVEEVWLKKIVPSGL